MARRLALSILFTLALAAQAHASCVCRCVEGEMRALCSSAIDVKPICPATACGLPPASIAPIRPERLPPPGTFQCERRQVLDPATGKYEWRRLCQ